MTVEAMNVKTMHLQTLHTPILVVVGPTAAGKSGLAVRLARALDGEVVSADSMQVYRHFDIGTAKVSPKEQEGVPHHLIDVVEPTDHFSAARFVELADEAIRGIQSRGCVAVVAGGTGLYVRALLKGLFQAPAADPGIRAEHRRIRDVQGLSALYGALTRVDPEAAARIDKNDFMRISRALEVYEQLGRPISALQAEHQFGPERYRSMCLGVYPGREILRDRIERRVEAMMTAGWLEEVRGLVANGYGSSPPMGALGYRQLRRVTQGTLDLEEAVRQTKRDTWRFAKRQLNWFGSDRGVHWIEDPSEGSLHLFVKRYRQPDGSEWN